MADHHWESRGGVRIEPVDGYDVPADARLVLVLVRRFTPRCAKCLAIGGSCHQQQGPRRWVDLPCCGHPVVIEYSPWRLSCGRCGARAVELLAWAEPYQRQTRRLQQHLALDAFSMPLVHVSTKWGLSWHTVRRAELDAIQRWDRNNPTPPLRQVGVDEKWLGRRHKRKEKFVTVVSNLETGVPIWIGYGRGSEMLKGWIDTLDPAQKAEIQLFAMDMHEPFKKAVRDDDALAHVAIVHDPFHVIKRAGEAVTELRRSIFFRAGPELRAVGRGSRWLVLRSWEHSNEDQRARLRSLFQLNGKLARAYQLVEELRAVLRAPDRNTLCNGLWRILRRTERRDNVPMRKLHESLKGYRNHAYLLAKLRFITANPVRNADGIKRFLALGIPTPFVRAA